MFAVTGEAAYVRRCVPAVVEARRLYPVGTNEADMGGRREQGQKKEEESDQAQGEGEKRAVQGNTH